MQTKEKIPILAVVGPTASGKTALGVELAKVYNGEVVSADSMQIYKGMDIATAKPTPEEMQGVPHHLIDILPRDTIFNVADYVKLAEQAIADIIQRGKLPILVGGTGLYLASLLDNVQFAETKQDAALRKELTDYAETHGTEALHERLKAVDPVAAAAIHPNNVVRVVRALEVTLLSGKPFSVQKAESRTQPSPYDACIIGLDYEDRQVLYDRINRRVDLMVENGLVEESYAVWKTNPKQTAANAIGYKELIPYFTGESDLSACIDKLKQETRRYAKRQLTWFRKRTDVVWIKLYKFNNNKEILEKSKKIIAKQQFLCYNRIGLFETTEK